ncbi:site-specific integrase [Thioalkalivibrio sp. ALJ3]|uniref:site-specific integrase n=1 Tax=Thioalkalivibrio sp. ALJ3 TaxID=1240557 RepID=UPI0003685A86|nr:site-specific integrase [Thioalkalivibrio sp. ALJ3]
MKKKITKSLLNTFSSESEVDIYDTDLPGFILRFRPNGRHSYRAQYARGRAITIGSSAHLTPAQAREEATRILSEAALGKDPRSKKLRSDVMTFGHFIRETYGPWLVARNRTGQATVKRLSSVFGTLWDRQLSSISIHDIEKIREQRLREGKKASTINRELNDLKAALRRAEEWQYLEHYPIPTLKALRTDNNREPRYLGEAEEKRLRLALEERDELARRKRSSMNLWRRERRKPEKTEISPNRPPDHLTPLVLLALNTGLRRGELLQLRWNNVDLDRNILTVDGANAKSAMTRHVPLNAEASRVFSSWAGRGKPSPYVFPGSDGQPMKDLKSSWKRLKNRAGLPDIRFHDLRHTFASKLVMHAVDLNTVRELLGHSDIKQTLRYAHLAPKQKAAAVQLLDTA